MVKKYLLYSACVLAWMAPAEKAVAQAGMEKDSLAQAGGYEDAFTHLLQKPIRNETFPGKQLGDHFFLMGGVGINRLKVEGASPSVQASWMVGDWLTPVHGVRGGMKGGWLNYGTGKNKWVALEADYLMNLTALGQAGYSLKRPLEVSALAGVEVVYARKSGVERWGAGVHAGLLAAMRLSDLAYAFVEPRITCYSNGVTPLAENSWRNYKMAGSVTVGLAYRLLTGEARYRDVFRKEGWDDNWFLSVGAGTGAVTKRPLRETVEDAGFGASLAVGKEVNPYSSFRAKLHVGTYVTQGTQHLKVANAQVDYLFNLTHLMGGYREGRRFWLHGVVGADLAASKYVYTELEPGLGAGLQFNFRTGPYASFYVEPRVDIYGEHFDPTVNSFRQWDMLASLDMGFTFYRREQRNVQANRGRRFRNISFWDNLFLQGALGGAAAGTSQAFRHPSDYVEPMVSVGLGKWLNVCSGVRLVADLKKYRAYPAASRKNMASAGVDYLFNVTNFIAGFDPDRRWDVVGTAGVRLGTKSEERRLYPGVQAGVQGLYHLNAMTGIFIEPSVQAYSEDLVDAGIHIGGMGFMGQVLLGVNLRMRGYDVTVNRRRFEDDKEARREFVYAAIGPSVQANNLNDYYFQAKAGYGRWYNPFAGWRTGLSLLDRKDYGRWTAEADWMLNLSTLAYGYESNRKVTLNVLCGLGMGWMRERQKMSFSPDVHVGGQLTVRVSPVVTLFAEPQLAGRFVTVKTAGKRIMPQCSALLGLSYYLPERK